MKIVILELPFYTLTGMPVHFELGPAYIASFLEQAGHTVSVLSGEAMKFESLKQTISRPIDRLKLLLSTAVPQISVFQQVMTNQRHPVWDAVINELDKERPDVIGISAITVRMTGTKIICQRIKEDLGDIPIVLGGIHPSSLPAQTLNDIPGTDYVVVGEGEETMKELVEYLGAPTTYDLHSIKGLAYRDDSRRPVINEPRELIQDLDSLPFPKRDRSSRGPEHMIITGRGCPYRCGFCASHVLWQRRVRYRSIENVIAEIAMLKAHFGAKRIRIVDDTFTLNKKRVLEFSDKVRENKLDSIEFSVGSRVDTLDSEMVAALKACGVREVSFGVESGSPHILQRISKDITPEQVERAVALVNAEGISSYTCYMLGHPGETKQDIEQSKQLLRQSKPAYSAVNVVTIYPQTGYAEIAASKHQMLPIDDLYEGFHESSATVNLTELTDEELQREYRDFIRLVRRSNLRGGLLIFLRQPMRVVNRLFGR